MLPKLTAKCTDPDVLLLEGNQRDPAELKPRARTGANNGSWAVSVGSCRSSPNESDENVAQCGKTWCRVPQHLVIPFQRPKAGRLPAHRTAKDNSGSLPAGIEASGYVGEELTIVATGTHTPCLGGILLDLGCQFDHGMEKC